jgi:hypothetical protein
MARRTFVGRSGRPLQAISQVMHLALPSALGRLACLLLLPLAAVPLGGCGGGGPGVSALYTVPSSLDELREEHFFDHPWPSDLRTENGAPRLAGYYNPRSLPIITSYISAMDGVLDGFSPAAAGFLRFDGPIDPATLPLTPAASMGPDASVQLIDVDPLSPERGQRRRFSLLWTPAEGVYVRPNTLAFMPMIGFPLRPHTRYALVVTSAVEAADGGPVKPSPDLSIVLGSEPAVETRLSAARHTLAPAIAEIEAAGVERGSIVHLAVFTTANPVKELFEVRDHLRKHVPPPTMLPDRWKVKANNDIYTEYTGAYGPSPNYQDGKLPFAKDGDGGQFLFADGHPKVVDTFTPRFSLTAPRSERCSMPKAGYPIVLYAHGTGGDYASYVKDGTAKALAERCIASMGVDQIFHGTRPGAPSDGNDGTIELLFFNFENPIAARTNGRQSALDEVQRARLFTESHARVPSQVSVTGQDILLDASKLMFFGHSQGGLNGPLYFAADDSVRGGVLSGAGAMITIGLLEKTKPTPSVSALVKTVFLGLRGEEEAEANEFHPIISMAQMIVDVVDPIHYGSSISIAPRQGFLPKSVYMTEGVNSDGSGDSFAPPHGIEAHALAIGLPLQIPFQRPIVESRWGGPQPITIPEEGLSGNLADGAASGVIGQWAVPADTDGHFVVFRVPEAQAQAAQFLRDLADNPKGRVPAP